MSQAVTNYVTQPVPGVHKFIGYDGSDFYYTHVDVDGNLRNRNLIWNTITLAWESMQQPILEAGSVTLSGTVTLAEDNKAMVLYDDGAGILYLCKAVVGTELTDHLWQIQKIDTTVSDQAVAITWADGDTLYDNHADSLLIVAALSYD